MRQKTSPIWTMPRDEFIKLLLEATGGISGVLQSFGIRSAGGNYRTLKVRAQQEGLDWNELSGRMRKQSLTRVHEGNRLKTSDLLVEHSKYSRGHLKERLISEGILKNECSRCGQGPVWFNEPLVMVLDHINGIHDDDRIENLRLLCPQCNSQMSTFAGRKNKGRKKSEPRRCMDCPAIVGRYADRCPKCAHKANRKTERPDADVLKKEADSMGWEATGRKYGVSGNAVRKWVYDKTC